MANTLLIKVEPNANNNKFYKMEELGNGMFKSSWGRVGTSGQSKDYPMNEWNSKYREKINKGYSDISSNTSVGNKKKHKDIDNSNIKEFIEKLMTFSKNKISNEYLCGIGEITKKQVDLAQKILVSLQNEIVVGGNIKTFNNNLVELYKTIPRKMSDVNHHLFKSSNSSFNNKDGISYASEMIKKESELLDTLKTQIKTDIVEDIDKTILEVLGIELVECDSNDISIIKTHMGPEKSLFKRAFKVINTRTNKIYNSNNIPKIKEELYWHGSRNENWLSIMENGLKVKPVGVVQTGSMFGNGIYFAPLFKKSLGYTSLSGSYWAKGNENTGYMALYNVNMGIVKDVHEHTHWCSSMDSSKCKKEGFHTMYAHAGKSLYNDEIIIYDESQCDIKYIVELIK